MRAVILLFCLVVGIEAKAQREVVQSFANNLSSWAETNSFTYLEALSRLYNSSGSRGFKTIVSDDIAKGLAVKYNVGKNESYEMDTYINWLQKEIDKGITIRISDIQNESPNSIPEEARRPGMAYVSAVVSMSGSSSYYVKDLFYIYGGKIVKIDKYSVSVDKSGRKTVNVDLSDIIGLFEPDNESWGITYNYGTYFPLGLSVNYAYSIFICGLDFGMTFEDEEYTTQKVAITDLMNYKIEKGKYKPKFFLTLSPGVYFKYFSISCGVGSLYMSGDLEKAFQETTFFENGISSSLSRSQETGTSGDSKIKFMLRPSVKGYIPIYDWSIVFGVGYDYIFDYEDLNGINFSIGFQYSLW